MKKLKMNFVLIIISLFGMIFLPMNNTLFDYKVLPKNVSYFLLIICITLILINLLFLLKRKTIT